MQLSNTNGEFATIQQLWYNDARLSCLLGVQPALVYSRLASAKLAFAPTNTAQRVPFACPRTLPDHD
jgi:hypothetical protein